LSYLTGRGGKEGYVLLAEFRGVVDQQVDDDVTSGSFEEDGHLGGGREEILVKSTCTKIGYPLVSVAYPATLLKISSGGLAASLLKVVEVLKFLVSV
jgi:hypothetical protein